MSTQVNDLEPWAVEAIVLFRKLSLAAQEAFLEALLKGVTLPATADGDAEFSRLCADAKAKTEARS